MEAAQKIKLVVLNEHTLGYILPELKDYVQILHESILKGAVFCLYRSSWMLRHGDVVRLASEKDFDDFRVCFNTYKNKSKYDTNEYEYAK